MKKITSIGIFLFIVFTLISQPVLSQTTLWFGVGYMFPLEEGELNPYLNSITYNPSISPQVHSSWGKGGSFGVNVDHRFDKYFDLEFGAKYRYGTSINYNDTVSALTNVAKDHLRFFMFSLGPIYDFDYKNLVFYIGTGINVGIDDKIINIETSSDIFGNTTVFNSTLTCEPMFGGYGELGAKYNLNSDCCFFFELRFDIASLTPEKLYYNSVIQNGNDITNTLLPYQQQISYTKNSPTAAFSQLEPTEEMAQSIPASSWGFNIGLTFEIKSHSNSKSTTKQQ